jgi:aarF domain-containing kinase
MLLALRSSRLIVLGRSHGHGPASFLSTKNAASSAGSRNTNTNIHPRQRFAMGIAGGVAIASLGSVAYLNEYLGGSEGLLRTVSFYSLAIPKYITYRYHMIMNSPDEVWDTLHRETSKVGLQKIMELQGFYVKSGQMAAANIGNAFPPIWQQTMAPLQDACPARPFHVVKAIIEKEYGVTDLDEIFTSIDETPIGAASIGQVHRAILKSNGNHVVVKIMYPGVEDVFRGDVRTIKMFCEVAQPVHVPPLLEIEKQFMTEFDYTREAQQLDQVRRNMLAAKLAGDPYKLCAIPKPYLELCKKHVLVMDELHGGKLTDELKKDMKRQMARMNVDDEKTFEQKFTKSENGPTSREYDVYIKTIDAQRRLTNLYSMLYNISVGWLPGMSKRSYEGKSSLPINHAKLIDDLLYIHGHQILVDGCFNGDPHPGNSKLISLIYLCFV